MRRKNEKSSLGVLLLFGLIIGGFLYVYNSVMFEREAPKISFDNNGYWNLKKPLNIKIDDASGIKVYKIILQTKDNEITLQYEQLINPKKSLNIKVEPPRSAYAMKKV